MSIFIVNLKMHYDFEDFATFSSGHQARTGRQDRGWARPLGRGRLGRPVAESVLLGQHCRQAIL